MELTLLHMSSLAVKVRVRSFHVKFLFFFDRIPKKMASSFLELGIEAIFSTLVGKS